MLRDAVTSNSDRKQSEEYKEFDGLHVNTSVRNLVPSLHKMSEVLLRSARESKKAGVRWDKQIFLPEVLMDPRVRNV